ncbi:MAG: alpha/beta fold hydrolase [Planctomycetota bacterium]|nr:alpha/beta fold hydrolase [Planctomycetota bacterium]
MTRTSDLGPLLNASGEALEYTYFAAPNQRAATVVIGHGLTANMHREWATTLATELAAAGYGSLRFSFSGNGDSEGDFLDSCPTKELADLRAVLDTLEEAGIAPLVYVGHSMGGAVGVMLMGAGEERVKALVSLAGMVHTQGFVERRLSDCGIGELMWDKPECPMGQTFLDDMSAVESVLPLAPDVRVPWLLVHGSQDDVVPPSESVEAQAAAGVSAELVVLEGADHSFTGGREREMARAVVSWLRGLA